MFRRAGKPFGIEMFNVALDVVLAFPTDTHGSQAETDKISEVVREALIKHYGPGVGVGMVASMSCRADSTVR